MDDLILRSMQRRTSEDEEEQLRGWRRASEANERRYQDAVRLWELSGQLRRGGVDEQAPTIEALLEQRRSRPAVIGLPTAQSRPGVRWSSWKSIIPAVAAIVALILGTIYFRPAAQPEATVASAEIVTGAAELSTVTLGDGTVARLAPSSRLRMIGESGSRQVWLDGRAYFAVTKDPNRKFRVRTAQGEAVVLGTRFDLDATQGELKLLVVEGNVELHAGGQAVTVGAQRLAEAGSTQEPAVAEVDLDYVRRSLDWVGNFIAFESTPLRDAARELSEHYDVSITVTDSALARQTVSGWFADEPMEDVVMMVCHAVRAQCAVKKEGVTIRP